MRYAIIFSFAAVFSEVSFAQISEKQLANEVIATAKSLSNDPAITYKYDVPNNEVRSIGADGEVITYIYLGNLYNLYKDSAPNERKDGLRRFLKSTTQLEELGAEDLKSVLSLRIRTPETLSIQSIMSEMTEKMTKRTFFEDGVWIIEVVRDSEAAVASVQDDDLETAKLTATEARDIAIENLRTTVTPGLWAEDTGIYYSTKQDDYDATRLVVLGPESGLPLSGDIIAFMPTYSIVLATGVDNTEILDAMYMAGVEMGEEQRPFSHRLWQRVDGVWSTYLPEKGSPAYLIAKKAALIDIGTDYTDQKYMMTRYSTKSDSPRLIAEYEIYETNEGDDFYSLSKFTDSTTSLPKTDYIVVSSNRTKRITWDDFIRALGNEAPKPVSGLTPVRYEFNKPISDEAFARVVLSLR